LSTAASGWERPAGHSPFRFVLTVFSADLERHYSPRCYGEYFHRSASGNGVEWISPQVNAVIGTLDGLPGKLRKVQAVAREMLAWVKVQSATKGMK
jgi:hypothetical protein